jgi:O-antigen ligase
MLGEKIRGLNFLSLCFLSCFPLLGMKITVVAIIIFTCLSALTAASDWKNIHLNKTKELLILLFPFLLILLRTVILDRSAEAFFYLEVSMSFLAFPAAFYLSTSKYTSRQRDVLLLLFVLSTILIITFGEYMVAREIIGSFGNGKTWKSTSEMFNDPVYAYQVRTTFENVVSLHPTYACIFLGIAFLLLFDRFLKRYHTPGRGEKYLLIGSMLLILVLQVNLASRTPFVATIFASLVLYFIFLKKKVYILYALGAALVLSTLLILTVPSFSSRFKEISFSNTSLPTENHENSFNLRTGIYTCSVRIIKDNWIWGVGPGNVQKELNHCYNSIARNVYNNKNYNTHNQFMDYWAGMGFLGPIALLLILVYVSWKNLKSGNPVVLAICLLFLVSLLTENVLNRQNGIVAFAFFMSLFMFMTPAERRLQNQPEIDT